MKNTIKPQRPVKVLQFGEGNFLRAFADYTIDSGNLAGILDMNITIVKPRDGHSLQKFKDQNSLYTVAIRGLDKDKLVETERIVTCIHDTINPYQETESYRALYLSKDLKFVISNTTEAGIVFDPADTLSPIPKTFPGKLAQILYERYEKYAGDPDAGLYIIPCELIEDNGAVLKQCVVKYATLWDFESGFLRWLEESCIFAGTLVDRIVSGYPKDNAEEFTRKLGYDDPLLVVAEPYQLWAIEADEKLRQALPLDKVTPNVIFTNDVRPYRQRKVRILNGSHTLLTPTALLWGKEYVRQCMEDETLCRFLHTAVTEEIIPSMDCLPENELLAFYQDVRSRFANPFLNHALKSISLNSVSKFNARLLPSIQCYYEKYQKLPKTLTFAFAGLLAYLHQADDVQDTEETLTFLRTYKDAAPAEFVDAAIAEGLFSTQLRAIPGFMNEAVKYLSAIQSKGIHKALTALLEDVK